MVCEVPGIFPATALRPPLFYTHKEAQGAAAAQLGARAPRSACGSGSAAGAELAAHCDRAAPLAYSQVTSTAAATSLSPSAFLSPCAFGKLTEGLILLGEEKPECYERENKSAPEDKDCYPKIALTTPKHWHFLLLMSGLVLMGDEEGQCLAPGLRGEQWGGWQAKTEQYNSSDMEVGRMRGPTQLTASTTVLSGWLFCIKQ